MMNLGLKILIAVAFTPVVLILSAGVSAAALSTHELIYIYGDDNFTLANGVTSGTGSVDDPYVIENWAIDASENHGIRIENTTKYFIIRNCVIENGSENYDGIYLKNVQNGRIENVRSKMNWSGVYVWNSNNNIFINNTFKKNYIHGISLYESENNAIKNNKFSKNNGGIVLYQSTNNILENNACENNFNGIYLVNSENNALSANTCENNEWAGIELSGNSSNNTLTNNTCENNYRGIEIFESNHNLLTHNTCMNNHSDGIYLYGSHNMLTNNVCENSVRGLYLSGSHNTSMNNIFKNNSTGMHISLSDNSVVSANVFENNKTGVRFSASSNNMFVNNIYNRNERGIEFVGNSHYNVFTNNIIENSSSHGIYIKPSEKLDNVYTISSYYNLFYLNRFSNNSLHAFDGASNYWDNGSVGNYWDDYTGTDTDGDGIGETPYLIADGKNQDNYPLVGIWNSSPKMSLPSGSVFQTKTPTLSWSQIIDISPPVTYELQVDNDSDFSSPEISVQVLSTSYTTSPLPNGTYYSRVRAVNSAGETSAWSSSLLFTISVPSLPLSLLAMIIVAIAFAVVLVATIRKRITAKVKVFQRVQFEAAINCG